MGFHMKMNPILKVWEVHWNEVQGQKFQGLGQHLHQGIPRKENNIKANMFFCLINVCFHVFIHCGFFLLFAITIVTVCCVALFLALCCCYLVWCITLYYALLSFVVVCCLRLTLLLLFVVVSSFALCYYYLLWCIVPHFALLLLVVVRCPLSSTITCVVYHPLFYATTCCVVSFFALH